MLDNLYFSGFQRTFTSSTENTRRIILLVKEFRLIPLSILHIKYVIGSTDD